MDNRFKLLVASFLTLITAGVGFSVRGGILGDWGAQFGFSKAELGSITGGGLWGFGLVILACSPFVDRIGYKPLLLLAFVLHTLSAVLTLAATPIFHASGKDAAYQCLYWGMFLFAVGNGVCESVINPLVATLYSKEKTHYLNILHAGWPAGLILGGLFAYFFCGENAILRHFRWEIPMAVFLIPTLAYGIMVAMERFPISEAKAAGVSFGEQLQVFKSPVLISLLVLHALIGYVELGTDSWIANIMNNVVGSYAMLLFVYTSGLMFVLRFCAGPIVEKINPVGLLLLSSLLGCIGLYGLSFATGPTVIVVGTIYALGKTFLWPTILGVVGERYPKGGALVMGAMGGVGMLSAGLLGGPGIGYKQDYYASKNLEDASEATYKRYVSDTKKGFLFLPAIAGLDGAKVATLEDRGADLKLRVENLKKEGKSLADDKPLDSLWQWWQGASQEADVDEPRIKAANIAGGQMALRWTSLVPLCMAVGFGALTLYFASLGGYRQEVLHGAKPDGERYTGGVEGP